MKTLALSVCLISVFAVALLSADHAAAAEGGLLCGRVDFQRVQNSELVNLFYLQDLGQKIKRIQCGLPGEILPICTACVDEISEETMTFLRPIVGRADHLLWHSQWHLQRATQELEPSHRIGGELAGEDFFYMHRMMIKMVQAELAQKGLSCIAPWKELPQQVDDKIWPVPRKFNVSGARDRSQAELLLLQKQLVKYQSAEYLRQISLTKLGQNVEPRLHQSLHNLYRGNPICSREAKTQGFCDDLVPVETSPLNKYFWKIHGLIDELVGLWLTANGYTEISTDCRQQKACYQWRGTWVGTLPTN